MPGALVVGSNGLLGEELVTQLKQHGWEAVGTTHRDVSDGKVRFDLDDDPARLLNAPAVALLGCKEEWMAFLVAAITGYDRCEKDPAGTRRVNVTRAVELARRIVQSSGFVIYPSSAAVFGDAAVECHEAAPVSPRSEYGRQKADAERGILGLISNGISHGGVAVARLTKVVGTRGTVGHWIATLRGGGEIEAATDVLLCPISLPFAANGLIKIAARRSSGIYHLSGESPISYFEFAMRLADALGSPRAKVHPVEIGEKKPGVAGGVACLAMRQTTRHLGFEPQALDCVLADLISSN